MKKQGDTGIESSPSKRVVAELLMHEKQELLRAYELSKETPPLKFKKKPSLPPKVDYTPQIPFVRHQGAFACGQNAGAACWDVMNELVSPYSPNVSANRAIWYWAQELRRDQVLKLLSSINRTPDSIPDKDWYYAFGVTDCQDFLQCCPVPGGKSYYSTNECFANFGCPSEGTELTDSDAIKWPTEPGNAEAPNYRMKLQGPRNSPWVAVNVNLNDLRYHLSTKPLRLTVLNWEHSVALIGYDDTKQEFKYINSWGDRFEDNGYGYINYSELNQKVQAAEYLLIEPPKPVPAVRVSFKHTFRQDVRLFLYGKQPNGTPTAKQIWPSGQRQDDSRNLTLTVTLPAGFAWPPSAGNKLYLQVLDSGANATSGGDLVEFTGAFAGSLIPCKKLQAGAAHFTPNTVATFSIP